MIRATAIPKEKWFKFASSKDYNDYSRTSWEESINRTSALLRDGRAAAPIRAPVVVDPPRPAPVMRMMPRLQRVERTAVAPAAAAVINLAAADDDDGENRSMTMLRRGGLTGAFGPTFFLPHRSTAGVNPAANHPSDATALAAADEEDHTAPNGILHFDEAQWIDFSDAVVAYCRARVTEAARAQNISNDTVQAILASLTGDAVREEIPF